MDYRAGLIARTRSPGEPSRLREVVSSTEQNRLREVTASGEAAHLRAGEAQTAPVRLSADNMTLTGSIAGQSRPMPVRPITGIIEASSEQVQVEQAIFTSIRTPMGEGYRLVAMSPGITSEERAEITRRCPSHGSVCDADESAAALASYPLTSERYCVGWTRYAGREHTSRGGRRVHTHLVVLEPDAFGAFAFDPFRVQVAMREVLGDAPDIKPTTCLEYLQLDVPPRHAVPWQAWPIEHVEAACRTAAALMESDSLLIVQAGSSLQVLAALFAVLPRALRTGLSASANLQYAQGRQMRLTCLGQDSPELQRAVQGQDVRVLDLQDTSCHETPFASWFDCARERCVQNRFAEFATLADQLDGPIDAAALDRIVLVCRDADGIEAADRDALEELVTRYADLDPTHPVESRLVRNILSAAVHRCGELQYEKSYEL